MNGWLFLQWCFQDFWRWLGLFMIVAVATVGVANTIAELMRRK